MELRFVASESTFAYFEALKAYLRRHGKPVAFYSDKHSIFRVSNENAASGNGMTQFGRALSELNIEILCAITSQAKGRIERALAIRLRGKMVEIYDFPDGRLEIRWKGRSLPYSAFDKLQRVSHAAIVENKRLGEILAWIKERQDSRPRFNRVPDGPRRSSQKPGMLKTRALQIAEAAKLKSKALRVSRRRSDMGVSATPSHAPSEAAK